MPLGDRTDCGNARFAGLAPWDAASTQDCLQEAMRLGFDFVELPLGHKALRGGRHAAAGGGTCVRSDLDLTAVTWHTQIIGRLSEVPRAGEETTDYWRRFSDTMGKELDWASYLGLQAVTTRVLHSWDADDSMDTEDDDGNDVAALACVAQALSQYLNAARGSMQMWLHVPICSGARGRRAVSRWHALRAMCGHHPQLRIALEIGPDLPNPEEELAAWSGEPIKAVVLPTSLYVKNSRGYPSLRKATQALVTGLFVRGCQPVLRDDSLACCVGADVIASAMAAPEPSAHPLGQHWEYLSYLFRKLPAPPDANRPEYEYRDFLQSPLQPLQDHLESATYEVFEKDKTKYLTYEAAVHNALWDRYGPTSNAAANRPHDSADDATLGKFHDKRILPANTHAPRPTPHAP